MILAGRGWILHGIDTSMFTGQKITFLHAVHVHEMSLNMIRCVICISFGGKGGDGYLYIWLKHGYKTMLCRNVLYTCWPFSPLLPWSPGSPLVPSVP